ncbi:MAG TPA: hypothetical protein IAA29_06595 [Candidatus Paenibacillus intestinavium]|nr:hypothetical protein [Candidatus Paenibacillus intestinavium]
MSEQTRNQKIIDLRSEVIKMRIQHDKDQQVIELMDKRNYTLQSALYRIFDKFSRCEPYSSEGFAYHEAKNALHGDDQFNYTGELCQSQNKNFNLKKELDDTKEKLEVAQRDLNRVVAHMQHQQVLQQQ